MLDRGDIERLRGREAALERDLASAAASAPGKLKALMGEHAHVRDQRACAERWRRLTDERDKTRALLRECGDDPELGAMAEADLARLDGEVDAALRALRLALLPPDPDARRNVILEIRAGTGGEEASLFAADLQRMYQRYAEPQGWRLSLVDLSPSASGGVKSLVCSIEGDGVYDRLRYESGVHRIQRVPVTEAQGRIHTSAATVAILPEAEDVDEVVLNPEDIRLDLYRASGPGGQKVNKTESAVRLTHRPTGIVVQSQDERSQHRNREQAMRVLRARVLDRLRADDAARMSGQRRSQIGTGDRSERIRTYNVPQNRVTDHRINLTLYRLDRILEGELDELIDALRAHDLDRQLQACLGG